MLKPIEVTEENFEAEVINSKIPTIVDFWAVWCGPCKVIAPYLEEIASEYSGKVKIAKVDVDNNQAIAAKYGIRSIPTVMFFKNGRMVDQVIGAYPKSHFEEKIGNLI
ncbi:MAG: thioredoxin [bacterium]|nr:MAG: thioredoxin [bacterium]